MSYELFVPGIPAPQGSKRAFLNKRTGRPVMVEACERLDDWRLSVASAARLRLGQVRPWPAKITMRFTFPRPKFHYDRNGNLRARFSYSLKTTKPDTDKLVRAVLDSLTGIAYLDDAQVVWLQASKAYASPGCTPGLTLHVDYDPIEL